MKKKIKFRVLTFLFGSLARMQTYTEVFYTYKPGEEVVSINMDIAIDVAPPLAPPPSSSLSEIVVAHLLFLPLSVVLLLRLLLGGKEAVIKEEFY